MEAIKLVARGCCVASRGIGDDEVEEVRGC